MTISGLFKVRRGGSGVVALELPPPKAAKERASRPGDGGAGETPLDAPDEFREGEPALDADLDLVPGVDAPLMYPLALIGLATCRYEAVDSAIPRPSCGFSLK